MTPDLQSTIAELDGLLERATPLLDGRLANIPHTSHHGMRVVGFKVDQDVAGLSDGIFMMEAARDALRQLPTLISSLKSVKEDGPRAVPELSEVAPLKWAVWARGPDEFEQCESYEAAVALADKINAMDDEIKIGAVPALWPWPDPTPPPAPGTARQAIETTDLSALKEEPSEEKLEAMARAGDAEEAAQCGEPSPWDAHDCTGTCSECAEFRSNRIAVYRTAYSAMKEVG